MPKKAEPGGTGAGTLLQKLAARALALSKGPFGAEDLLPVAQAKRHRYEEGGSLPRAEARSSRSEGGRQMAQDGQAVLSCGSEAVADANWNGNKAADDFDTSFDCRISRRRSQRNLYLQTAEDEVRVTAAAKGDNKALRKKASRETRH